jgi:uncharacterized protein with PIN domain
MPKEILIDAMLTNVGRWLRIIGIKASIATKDMSDKEILNKARKENSIIVTEDKELFERAKGSGIRSIYINKMTNLKEKLLSILKKCRITKSRVENFDKYTLCTKCGGELEKINIEKEKEKWKEKIPSYILERYKEVWICEECGQVYWEGSHWKKIRSFLKEIANEMER